MNPPLDKWGRGLDPLHNNDPDVWVMVMHGFSAATLPGRQAAFLRNPGQGMRSTRSALSRSFIKQWTDIFVYVILL